MCKCKIELAELHLLGKMAIARIDFLEGCIKDMKKLFIDILDRIEKLPKKRSK